VIMAIVSRWKEVSKLTCPEERTKVNVDIDRI
jgi:hypothetical protein